MTENTCGDQLGFWILKAEFCPFHQHQGEDRHFFIISCAVWFLIQPCTEGMIRWLSDQILHFCQSTPNSWLHALLHTAVKEERLSRVWKKPQGDSWLGTCFLTRFPTFITRFEINKFFTLDVFKKYLKIFYPEFLLLQTGGLLRIFNPQYYHKKWKFPALLFFKLSARW